MSHNFLSLFIWGASVMTDSVTLSPIQHLLFKQIGNHSRADAFGAALLRSTFRKRYCFSVFRRWFNWMSWKKQGLQSCVHSRLIPLIVTQAEFRVAQVLKNTLAWYFISWSITLSKKQKQKQLQCVVAAISRLHKLHRSISKLNHFASLIKSHDSMSSKFATAHSRCSLSKSFNELRFRWRAANLGNLHILRLKIARFNLWKTLCTTIVASWNRFYQKSMFLRHVRIWRTLINVRRSLIDLQSRVAARFQSHCLQESFCAWSTRHSKLMRATCMGRTIAINASFHNWLLESVVNKNQSLLDTKIQSIFQQKRMQSAIHVLASWTRKSRTMHNSIVSKQLHQKTVSIKSIFLRMWAWHAFQKRNKTYKHLMNKRIKINDRRLITRAFVRWWIRVKQVMRVRILQQRRRFNVKKIATTLWRITTLTMLSCRLSNMDAMIRRRSRQFQLLVLTVWRHENQEVMRAQQLSLQCSADSFHLSCIFRAFFKNCKNQKAHFKSFFNHHVLKFHFGSWRKQLQDSSMLECASSLLSKMRTIREAHVAVRHLKQNVSHQESKQNRRLASAKNIPKSQRANTIVSTGFLYSVCAMPFQSS